MGDDPVFIVLQISPPEAPDRATHGGAPGSFGPVPHVMIAALAMIAAAIGGLVTLWLAVDFARDPDGAMRRATHRAGMLPQVMVGRYAAFTALAFGAAAYGDPWPILFLFLVFSAVSFYDAALYARAGHRAGPHVAAGAACWIVIGLAGAALAGA
jgi:hypothetical protein